MPVMSGYKKSKAAILPIPFDGTSTWGKGADKGPEALIKASQNMELYDIETNSEPCNIGIYTEKPVIAKKDFEMAEKGYASAKKLVEDGKFLITLGGEHSISYGPMKAHAEKFGKYSILHFDAHTDMRDEYEGSKHNHACIMARSYEFADKIVSVGIRSMDRGEWKNIDRKKHTIFFAEEIYASDEWMAKAIAKLSNKVYITIDLDVFDTGILPSTGTPEPGGMGWYQVLKLLRKVAEQKEIIGCDVVELCPEKTGNVSKPSEFLGAKLVYKLIAYKFFLKK